MLPDATVRDEICAALQGCVIPAVKVLTQLAMYSLSYSPPTLGLISYRQQLCELFYTLIKAKESQLL